jgi:hypothetical protein
MKGEASDDGMEGGIYCAGVNDHCYEDDGLGIKYVVEFVHMNRCNQ